MLFGWEPRLFWLPHPTPCYNLSFSKRILSAFMRIPLFHWYKLGDCWARHRALGQPRDLQEITSHAFDSSRSSSVFRLSFNVRVDCSELAWARFVNNDPQYTHDIRMFHSSPLLYFLVNSPNACVPLGPSLHLHRLAISYVSCLPGPPNRWGSGHTVTPAVALPSKVWAERKANIRKFSSLVPSRLPLQITHPTSSRPTCLRIRCVTGEKNADPQVLNLGILFQ